MLTWKHRVALLVALGLLIPVLPTATAVAGDISISVTKWDRDTSNGTIVYDVTLRGSCSAYSCGWRLTGFYADGTIEEGLRGIAVGTVYGSPTTPAFEKQVSGTLAPGEAMEITHLKASLQVSADTWIRTDLYPVSAPYPDPWATLTVANWRVDPATRLVDYDLTLGAGGLGQRLGPCGGVRCAWRIEAYSTTASGPRLEHYFLNDSNSGGYMWTVNRRVTTTGFAARNVTLLRAVVAPLSCTAPCAYETVETWRAVSGYVYKDHDMERTSGGLAPVLAANGQFFCTNFLLQAGTHYLRSMLTDQFLACEAAVLAAAGYTIYSVQRAIVDAGGG